MSDNKAEVPVKRKSKIDTMVFFMGIPVKLDFTDITISNDERRYITEQWEQYVPQFQPGWREQVDREQGRT